MTVYILGAGPAGLALAHGLTLDSDIDFVILERSAQLGGLAQTINWDDNGYHDLGPHKIFTLDESLLNRVHGLLPKSDWLTRPKQSSIFMKGHYLPYPPSPFSLIGIYGLPKFFGMVFQYGMARVSGLFSRQRYCTFADDLKHRVGTGLYEALFKPIALKLWGNPEQLDIKLSQGRVQTPSLVEVIGRLLKLRRSSDFEALQFDYPKGGLQKIWNSIKQSTKHQGKYLVGHEVCGIEISNNEITKIRYKHTTTGKETVIELSRNDFVFSTLPLGNVVSLFSGGFNPALTEKIAKNVTLNDLILVFLRIDKPSLLEESWVFVPDPDISFHRLSEQESFDPEMTPKGSIVCCEIMNNEMRPMGKKTDDELIESAIKGLATMGYKDFKIMDKKVIRLKNSYPVFRPGFEGALNEIISELDRFGNFRTIGRQGAFNYIGTLDAMDIGYGAARWIIKNLEPQKQEPWKAERNRTKHYPVLD